MSLLARAVSGPIKQNHFMVIYGQGGVGKSTFASRFPKPIFIATEDGVNHLDVSKIREDLTFQTVMGICKELLTTKHEYQTLVIDSLDALEFLIFNDVCKEAGKASIADIPYGQGYSQALNKWSDLVNLLKQLRSKMHIILVAHSIIKQINDPNLPLPFDKHVIKLHQKAADFIKEQVDAVLFACYEVSVLKAEGGRRAKAVGEGNRILQTMASPGAEGKNRYSLPPILPLDFDEFMKAQAAADPTDPETVKMRIEKYLPQIKDADRKKKAEEFYEKAKKGSLSDLQKLEQKLTTIVETQ